MPTGPKGQKRHANAIDNAVEVMRRPAEEMPPRPLGKKVEPLTPAEQRRRFEELSRELGTDNGETLDRVFGKIVPPKIRSGNQAADE